MTEWLVTFVILTFSPGDGFSIVARNEAVFQTEASPCKEVDEALRKRFSGAYIYMTCEKLDPKVKPSEYKRGNQT